MCRSLSRAACCRSRPPTHRMRRRAVSKWISKRSSPSTRSISAGIRAPFLKRFRLEGSGDRSRWTQLVAEGTAFSLPAEQLAHTRIEFAPGEYRYVRVTWDDTNSARVAAAGRRDRETRDRASSPGPILRAPIAIAQRPSEPGRSRFRLTLPAARLPIVALELTVGGGHLSRDAHGARGLAGRRAGAAADHRQRAAGPRRAGRPQRGRASHSDSATARAAARSRGRRRRQSAAAAGGRHGGVRRTAVDLFRGRRRDPWLRASAIRDWRRRATTSKRFATPFQRRRRGPRGAPNRRARWLPKPKVCRCPMSAARWPRMVSSTCGTFPRAQQG